MHTPSPYPSDLVQATVDSPLGPLLALASSAGLHGLWFDAQQHHPGPQMAPVDDAHPWIQATRTQLAAYFAGTRTAFDLPLAPIGTPFQQAVWARLLGIGFGQTDRYGRIAQALDRPGGARAVGLAVGRNPITIIVPCHRVVGENGQLTGYAGGLPRKQFLLALESRAACGTLI